MNRKSIFYLVLILIVGINAHAFQAPVSLSLQGSAAESTTPIPMKLVGTFYELYTSLKTGNYSFAGDNSIAQASITVTESLAPYRIRVNYSGSTPIVEVKKIEKITLWAAWDNVDLGILGYTGNSTFEAKGLEHDGSFWGGNDDRYRIRIYFEGNAIETYTRDASTTDDAPNASTAQSYYNLVFLNYNGQWDNNPPLYKIAQKYKHGAKLFNAKVVFNTATGANYTHYISDYTPETSLPSANSITLQGTALESSTVVMKKKSDNVFEFVGGLKQGEFTISGNGINYYTKNNSSIVMGNTPINISLTGTKPYYIKVDLNTGVLLIKEILSVNSYMSSDVNNKIDLTYIGDGKFQGTKDSQGWIPQDWGDDERYKIKMSLKNVTNVFWGALNSNNNRPEDTNTSGSDYNLYSVNDNNWDYSFKFRENTRDQKITMVLDFAASGVYSHSYVIGTLPLTLVDFRVTEEKGRVKLVWKTENEVNVNGFELERSIDGMYFETLGKVRSNQQLGLQQYLLYDQNVADFSVIYYRLKMVDNDGTTRFSNVIALKITALKENVLKVYNLSDSYLQVVHPNANNNAQIEIYGIDGRIINSIKVNQGEETSKVNVSSLKNGVYVINYKDEIQSLRTKFIR